MLRPRFSLSNDWIARLALCALVGWVYFFPPALDLFLKKSALGYPSPDFYAYFIAGKAYNLGVDPYLDHHVDLPVLNNPRIEGFSGFIYPPTVLPFYGLLARLSYNAARAVWALLNLGALLAVLGVLLARAKPAERPRLFMTGALLTLTSYPVLTHLGQGQVDLLVCSLSVLAYLQYRSARQWSSALLLSLAILIKFNPIVLLAALVLYTWDYKYLLRFGLVFALVVAASLLFFPPGYYLTFIKDILPDISQGRAYYTNQSLIRLVAYQAPWPSLVAGGGFALFSAFCLYAGWRRRRAPNALPAAPLAQDAIFLMNILALLLFSGHSWTMAYVWLILPLAELLPRLWQQARPWFFALAALAVILVSSPVSEAFLLNSLNLLGGSLLLLLLLLLLLAPRLALRPAAEG